MSKTEVKPGSIVLEYFMRPTPVMAVFIVDLMSHVGQNKRVTQYGEENAVHFNIRPANTNPLFSTLFILNIRYHRLMEHFYWVELTKIWVMRPLKTKAMNYFVPMSFFIIRLMGLG